MENWTPNNILSTGVGVGVGVGVSIWHRVEEERQTSVLAFLCQWLQAFYNCVCAADNTHYFCVSCGTS